MAGAQGTPAVAYSPTGISSPLVNYDTQDSPFNYVRVDRLLRGGTQVSWALIPTFGPSTPLSFNIQWARAGNETWTSVTTVADAFVGSDATQRDYSAILDGFYRVVLTDGDGSTYASKPSNFPSTWTLADLRLCDYIRIKEQLLYTKSGVSCWILFRKFWGTTCPTCADATTGAPRDPRCATCFGTGFVGGYHAPYPTTGAIMKTDEVIIEQAGTISLRRVAFRTALLPMATEHDIVIVDGSDDRLKIAKVSNLAEIRGRPVVQQLELIALPPSHAVYDLTWSGSNDPSEGESTTW